VINLYSHKLLYSNLPPSVPLRLAQARSAIFFKTPFLGPRASLRSTNETLDGAEVVCELISYGTLAKTAIGPRRWEETEYCVEPASGNLISYSTVPGMYVLFDYSKAIRFHGKIFLDKFIVTQQGQTVIGAQVPAINVADVQDAIQTPVGGNALTHVLPAALSHDIGSDSQRPFAIVIVGGLISDLVISIFLLPMLYVWMAREGDTPPAQESEFL
jgi:hypothetical protein